MQWYRKHLGPWGIWVLFPRLLPCSLSWDLPRKFLFCLKIFDQPWLCLSLFNCFNNNPSNTLNLKLFSMYSKSYKQRLQSPSQCSCKAKTQTLFGLLYSLIAVYPIWPVVYAGIDNMNIISPPFFNKEVIVKSITLAKADFCVMPEVYIHLSGFN